MIYDLNDLIKSEICKKQKNVLAGSRDVDARKKNN